MYFLQCFVGKEAETSIGDDTQDGGSETSVQCLQAFFTGYSHKHVQDVTVPRRSTMK